eukprot:g82369.t1
MKAMGLWWRLRCDVYVSYVTDAGDGALVVLAAVASKVCYVTDAGDGALVVATCDVDVSYVTDAGDGALVAAAVASKVWCVVYIVMSHVSLVYRCRRWGFGGGYV